MKRRDVIKLGAVAAGAGAGVPGCALPRMLGTLSGENGAAAFNAMLDDQLGRLEKPGLLQRIVAKETGRPLSAATQAKIDEHDALFRRMLSTVLLTQSFRELPIDTQLEPAVQDRMWSHSDLIGSMVFQVSDMLAGLDEARRKQIKDVLRERPDLPMMVGEALDERAATAGISRGRRNQLRSMMTQATFRLRHQHPGALIDEYVAKVERLRPSTAQDGTTLGLTERLGEREFWRYQRARLHLGGQPSATRPGQPAPSAPRTPAHPLVPELMTAAYNAARQGDCTRVVSIGRQIQALDPESFRLEFAPAPELSACVRKVMAEGGMGSPDPAPRRSKDGVAGLRAGGIMLGIGVVVTFVSALLVEASFGALYGVTAGVLLVGIGLLVLLISALIYASND